MSNLPSLLLVMLAMIFTVLGSSRFSTAEEPVTRSHLIIVADHSTSMHTSGAMFVLTNAIITTLDSFPGDCGETKVTYIAWGDSIRSVSANVNG
ncbi:MAG: hypothetical protein ACK4SL_03505 [Candidatus Paceibacteria bacterium]